MDDAEKAVEAFQYSTGTIALLGIAGLIAIIIPIFAIVFYRKRHSEISVTTALIGAGTFVVFAMLLEQLAHMAVMKVLPTDTLAFGIYGALAAGVFEETGRFAAFNLLKKRRTPQNAVMLGLGHGGAEAALLMGVTLVVYAGIAVVVNANGVDAAIEILTKKDASKNAEAMKVLDAIKDYNIISTLLSLYERIIAMVFHICMSLWVFTAVEHKKIMLFPAAVLTHALLDFPAMLYQQKIIKNIPIVYAILTAFVAAVAIVTVKLTKSVNSRGKK